MQYIDKDIHDCCALLVDSNMTSRNMLAAQLRDLGVGTVKQTGRVQDARQILEQKKFDLVLCDHSFERSEMTGQQLLDELRREQLLPYATVFVMITSKATYAQVAEAAESALDGFLVKPYTANTLAERLREARRRKTVLADIFEAIEHQDFVAAAEECMRRLKAKEQYWLYAARIGAELYLRIDQHEAAGQLFGVVAAARALPWARLGVARAHLAAGRDESARGVLDELVADTPDFADTYDVLGRTLVEQGNMKAAFETYRKAAELTPGSITRLLHAGTLAFYAGQSAAAVSALEHATAIGVRSKMFNPHALVLLGLLHFDAGDTKGVKRDLEHLGRLRERDPDALRLRRFNDVLLTLRRMLERDVPDAVKLARALAEEATRPDMDMEAACSVVALWSRLNTPEVAPEDLSSHVKRVAQRYCVSHASTEMLIAAAQSRDPVATLIRDTHNSILAMAESAMSHALNGSPRMAVEALLSHGGETRNSKLIQMAGLVTRRYQDKIDDSSPLLIAATELQEQYCKLGEPITGSRPGGRSAGGLSLRA